MTVFHEVFGVSTDGREQFVDVTHRVQSIISQHASTCSGICVISSAHTTAGITVNENADPDVVTDMLGKLKQLIPQDRAFMHREGNSDAHIKTTLVGLSVQIPVLKGRLVLGTWQGVYFCEFDGPRSRKVHVSFVGE